MGFQSFVRLSKHLPSWTSVFDVNCEHAEGEGKRVKSLPVQFTSIHRPNNVYKKPGKKCLQKMPTFCILAHFNTSFIDVLKTSKQIA